MSWKLRKQKVRDKPTGEYKRVRENPIRETAWKHDRLKVPKLGEVKIYMHRPLQGDPTGVTLVKKRVAGMLILPVNFPIHRKLNRRTRLPLIWERLII